MIVPDDRPDIPSNPLLEMDTNLDWIGKLIKQIKYGDLS
jgi:hypothetical protein